MGLRPPSSFSANASAINRVDSMLRMDTPFPRNRQVHTMGPVDRGHVAEAAGPVVGDGRAWGAPFAWNRQVMCSHQTEAVPQLVGWIRSGMASLEGGFGALRHRCFTTGRLIKRWIRGCSGLRNWHGIVKSPTWWIRGWSVHPVSARGLGGLPAVPMK